VTKLNINEAVRAHAVAVFGSEEDARRWLYTPHPALADKAPLDLLVSDIGTAAVRKVLSQIETGDKR
jgi:putative toxin-antitoxin system antitoxin component (TIGR02293 family)